MNEVMLGEYEVPDASRLLGALEKAAIAVRVDELDERHRINSRGEFGRSSRIRAWVEQNDLEMAQHIKKKKKKITI